MDRDTSEVCLVCLLESEGEIGLEGSKLEHIKGCISNESCVINFVSDVPSARETTTICLNRYNTKKKKTKTTTKRREGCGEKRLDEQFKKKQQMNQNLSVSIHLYCSRTVNNKQRMQSPQNS